MLLLMMKFFREICHVSEKKFKARLHIHDNQDEHGIKEYWSVLLKIPLEQFYKTQISGAKVTRQSPHILEYGTLHVIVHSATLVDFVFGSLVGLKKVC